MVFCQVCHPASAEPGFGDKSAKVTENIRVRVEQALDKMVQENQIEEQGGLLVVSSRS